MFALKIYTFFFGKFVGYDNYGNGYYCNKEQGAKQKRWVFYKGVVEATKVENNWYGWLHHMTDKLPSSVSKEKKKWQKQHLPNFTATSKKYQPNSTEINDYTAWEPK